MALLGAVQTVPHLPQLEVSLVSSTQEPLQAVSEPQSVEQTPAMQTFPAAQVVLQLPQWLPSARVSTHSAPHFVYPELQSAPHSPASHRGEPLAGIGQTLPQVPQLETSEASFTHVDSQSAKPALQRTPQPVAAHRGAPLSAVGQDTPHALQFSGSSSTSTHEPPQFCAVPPQVSPHVPPEQASPSAQAWPQAPQLPGSLLVSTQSSPHFAKPLLQVEPHTPSMHTAMPSLGALQAVSQPPQCEMSELVATQPSSQAT